jgi:ATP-dependent Clp protease adaptor protein ClpS
MLARVAGAGDDRQRQGSVLERKREKEARPPRYKVVLYNDDYTPMQFVVNLLETVFRKSPVEANALMLQIHRGGSGIAGVYTHEVAETKVSQVHKLAEERGYPLRAGVEAE